MVGDPTLPDNSVHRLGSRLSQISEKEIADDEELLQIAADLLPHYGLHWNAHSVVTLRRQTLSRLIYYTELYKQILDVPGVICEFGVMWGATLSTLVNLRGIFEPYNHSRRIIGFDTFEGFASVHDKDGGYSAQGDYATQDGYETTLERILNLHEQNAPISHVKKFELVKGDASVSITGWLEKNPHAIVSMAIFDMDIYQPTKVALEAILPRLTKGSLLVFDELNCPHWPGETLALQEVLGANNLRLRRFPHQAYCSWAVFGE